MQARYYDPVIGRFYSNDPVGVLGHMQRGNPVHGFGRYTYVNNNPYKYVDPDGEFGLVGAFIGAVVETGAQLISNGGNFSELIPQGQVLNFAFHSKKFKLGLFYLYRV
jgi:hypothetical protein